MFIGKLLLKSKCIRLPLFLFLWFYFCLQENFAFATGEKGPHTVSKNNVFYSQKVDLQEWQEWFSDKKDYIQQTINLFQTAVKIVREQALLRQKAFSSRDTQQAAQKRKKAEEKISRIVAELQKLPSPEGFSTYHAKIIQSCQIMQRVINAYSEGGSRYAAYLVSSATLAIDAVKSLQQLYLQHGASQKNLDELSDMVINTFFKDTAFQIKASHMYSRQE